MAWHMQYLAFFEMPGGGEWLVILFIGLLVFGRRLPEVARSLGKSVNEFKKGMREFQDSADEVASDLNKATNEAVSEADTHATETTYDGSPESYGGQTTDESAPQAEGSQVVSDPAAEASDDSSPDKTSSTDTFPEPMS